MTEKKTLLAVLAHPDDESFGLGGTLALYARKGCDVYYVCATRGEAGSFDEERLRGFKDAAEMRTAETMGSGRHFGHWTLVLGLYKNSHAAGTARSARRAGHDVS